VTILNRAAFPFADLALARRLERVEALSTARFVEARARLDPSSGAGWIEVAGAYAIYDGVASPVTQTFGLGTSAALDAADLERIEAFFRERGAPVYHEVSPLADPAVVALLTSRGYQPFEFTSVLFRPVSGETPTPASTAELRHRNSDTETPTPELRHRNSDTETPTPELRHRNSDTEGPARVRVRRIDPGEADLYAQTAAAGWGEFGYGDFMRDMARVGAAADGGHLFIAEIAGRAVATGALNIHERVAHFAGASTVPDARGRGAQSALLGERLRYAATLGCDIATMGAVPGSGSQRNAERNGFRVAYTRIKWRLP
jgi:GNAT superfamily N-acetyltransferase